MAKNFFFLTKGFQGTGIVQLNLEEKIIINSIRQLNRLDPFPFFAGKTEISSGQIDKRRK